MPETEKELETLENGGQPTNEELADAGVAPVAEPVADEPRETDDNARGASDPEASEPAPAEEVAPVEEEGDVA